MPDTDNAIFFKQVGEGRPLLLIHGLLVSGAMFDPLLPLLEAQYRLIVPDLRGHGRSQHLPPPYTAAQHAADLMRVLDDLSLTQADVLGYSQGGTVAQQLAHDYPHRVSRLILVCTYACNLLTWREKLEGRLMPPLVRLLGLRRLARLMANAADELNPEQAARLSTMIAANGKPQALAAVRALQTFDSRNWLGKIQCPTLVIAGSGDTAVPLHHAHMLHTGIPHAELRVIAGAKHTLLWTHTQQLAALLP
jgi:3-oxoadipate enol-lactonase